MAETADGMWLVRVKEICLYVHCAVGRDVEAVVDGGTLVEIYLLQLRVVETTAAAVVAAAGIVHSPGSVA